jgi:hypothetical protein
MSSCFICRSAQAGLLLQQLASTLEFHRQRTLLLDAAAAAATATTPRLP